MSHGLFHQTCTSAYAPFTPNNSEQRSPHTCYRGCWHVISRGLFLPYRHHPGIPSGAYSSDRKGLYNLTAFFTHAASLRQTCVHCGRFLPAAHRSGLGRISVPVWPITLSGRLLIVGLVGSYPTNYLIRRRFITRRRQSAFLPPPSRAGTHSVLPLVSKGYPQPHGRFPTCYSPVRRSRKSENSLPLDLHG